MNTHAEYRRHSYRPPEQPAAADAVEPRCQRARSPSRSVPPVGPAGREQTQKRVAWVRPTELASYVGPMVGRGIDLQAELVRRARRTPTTATRTLRHSAPHRPTTSAASPEGLGL